MGPVRREEARVGDESALDGTPLIGVLGLEVRPDQDRRAHKKEETIEQDFPPARESHTNRSQRTPNTTRLRSSTSVARVAKRPMRFSRGVANASRISWSPGGGS